LGMGFGVTRVLTNGEARVRVRTAQTSQLARRSEAQTEQRKLFKRNTIDHEHPDL